MNSRAKDAAQIRADTVRRVYEEGLPVAVAALIEIAGDKAAPKNPRVAAARALAEMGGLGGATGDGQDKPLSEMTRAELSAARDQALAYLAELERPVLELTATTVQPEPADDAPPAGDLFD